MLGDLAAALNACSEGLRHDPDAAELLFRKAGQPAEAEACWRRVLTLKHPDQFCSVEQGIYGHLTCETSPSWPRPGGSGKWSSTSARATPRPWRAGKHSGKSRRLPPGSASPTPSASTREVTRDIANPAP